MNIKNSEFKVHKLNEKGVQECGHVSSLFDEIMTRLSDVCIASREFSLVKTKLEEACFFAKKNVCMKPENQEAGSGN